MYLITGFIIAYVITTMLGSRIIPFLIKLEYGQIIKEIGPTWHKNKQGTPTMGGLMFIVGIMVAASVGYMILLFTPAYNHRYDGVIHGLKFFSGILAATGFGAIGFVDDYMKVVKKRNLGLMARYKTLWQILVGSIYLICLYFAGQTSTVIIIPFLGQLDVGFAYYLFMLFIIIGTVNAVNLTDGIDGLAATVTTIAAIAFLSIGSILKLHSVQLMAACLMGGCVGFVRWNIHPAKVFMGDTGSMFLGGMMVALAFTIEMPIILVFIGIIYIIETLSVIIQMCYFRISGGKRLFKMSPIHHHFEMSGYSENKIVVIFSVITIIGCLLAILSVIHMIKS